jgi:uncharacterized repeat protein (TIGR01451 family)
MMHDQKKRLPAVLLSPRGPYRVGDVVSAAWSMTNFADRDLTGGRLVLSLPASVDPVLGSSSILGASGEAIASAFTPEGYRLGTIRRGESINAVFDLRFARETGPPQSLLLALELDEGSSYVSEPVELVLRARALLAIAASPKTYEIDAAAKRFGVALTLENVGEMRAERIDLNVPVPNGFALAAVRLSKGAIAGGKQPFRLPDLPHGDSLGVVLEFEARGAEIGDHVEIDGIRIDYAGGRLYPEPITVHLEREAGFLSSTLAAASTTVEPGAVVRIDLAIENAGQTDERGVTASFSLPSELSFCPGTIAVNGGSDPRRNDPRSISVGTVLGRSTTLVSLYASVVSPLAHDETFSIFASVDNQNVAPLQFTVKSQPAFAQSPSSFELEGPPVVGAGETRTLRVRAANIGTADAQGVRIRVISPQLVVERAALVYSSGARENVTLKPTVSSDGVACSGADLGTVAARDLKTLEVDLRAPDHFSDGDSFSIRGDLRYSGGPDLQIGALTVAGRCRPSIDAKESALMSSRLDPLRVGQVRTYTLRIKNSGLAPARGVAVSLNLPGMLAIEAINGEPARSDIVSIREIPAGAAVEVPIALRLVESIDGGAVVAVAPIVGGEALSTVRLEPVAIATAGQALVDEFTTKVVKRDDELVASLSFRNVGDAVAHHVVVSALDVPNAYVPESTRVGDAAVPDLGGASLLSRGITLPPLGPGREMTVSYRMNESDADGARVAFVVRSRTQDNIVPEPAIYRAATRKDVFTETAATLPPPLAPVPVTVVKKQEPEFPVAPPPPAAVPTPVAVVEAPVAPVAPAPVETRVEHFIPHDFGREYAASASTSNGNGNGNGNGHGATPVEAPPAEVAPIAVAVAQAVEASVASVATAVPPVPSDAPKAYGLAGYIVLDAAEVERIRRVAETALSIEALGTYRHFFAMRALVPRSLLGASTHVKQQWESVHERARADLRTPFLQAAAPDFEARTDWANQFYDESSAHTAALAIGAIKQADGEHVSYDALPVPDDQLRGAIGHDFESYMAPGSQPNGSVLNLILAEAMPTESARDPHLSKALKRYRERLKLLFAALLYQNPVARHERMLSGLDIELDDTLRAIVDRLHDPRWA